MGDGCFADRTTFPRKSFCEKSKFYVVGYFLSPASFTDGHQQELGWFNPLSWSYLGFPYVSNKESGLGVALSLLFALLLLGAALFLEGRRDNGAGYFKG